MKRYLGVLISVLLLALSVTVSAAPPAPPVIAKLPAKEAPKLIHAGSVELTIHEDDTVTASSQLHGIEGAHMDGTVTPSVTPDKEIAPGCHVYLRYGALEGAMVAYPSADCNYRYKIRSLTLSFWETNVVDRSQQEQLGDDQDVECGWNDCEEVGHISFPIERTAEVHAKLHYEILKIGVKTLRGDLRSEPIAFNDAGSPYPEVAVTGRSGMSVVPFRKPYTGWGICEDNPDQLPTCWRDTQFATKLRTYYGSRRWTVPSGAVQAHHIAPLEFGGGNGMANGVFLSTGDHTLFTEWFREFTLIAWEGDLPFGGPAKPVDSGK